MSWYPNRIDLLQPPSQMVSKGTGDASPSKQFLRIRPAGESAKMRKPVQVSTACHFVTGAFLASDPHIVEQFISRGLPENRSPSDFAYGNFSEAGFNFRPNWTEVKAWPDFERTAPGGVLHNLASSAKWYHFAALQIRKQCKQGPVYSLTKILLRIIFVNRLSGKRPKPLERCLAAAAVPSFRWLFKNQILHFCFCSMWQIENFSLTPEANTCQILPHRVEWT